MAMAGASGANVYSSGGGLHFWHYDGADNPTETEKRIDELLDAGVATLDNDEAFEIYKEYQIMLADDDLGLVYTVNAAATYAYSNTLANANIVSPIASPSGNNGLTMDLVFRK
jgi:ABC-type transport system substrate-binding protein